MIAEARAIEKEIKKEKEKENEVEKEKEEKEYTNDLGKKKRMLEINESDRGIKEMKTINEDSMKDGKALLFVGTKIQKSEKASLPRGENID